MSTFSCKLFVFLFGNLAFGAGSAYLGSGIKKYAVICCIPFMYFPLPLPGTRVLSFECHVSFFIFVRVSTTTVQGASLGVPFFTAYKALILRAQTKPGETVLIHGASGAVGTAAVQIAR
jgi:hypothetical protein